MIKLIKYILKKTNYLEAVRNSKTYINLAYQFNPSLKKQLEIDLEFYKPFIPKGTLCFDIGANIGGKLYVFNKLGARIVAVEPDGNAFRTLFSRYGEIKNVKLLKIGLGEKQEMKTLLQAENSTLSTVSDDDYTNILKDQRFAEKAEMSTKEEVEIDTLDNLISLHGLPHYCKIATVGYELAILKGLSSPIPYISLTCNLPYHIGKTKECVQLISKLGTYEFNYLYSDISNGFSSRSWLSENQMLAKFSEISKVENSKYVEVFARKNSSSAG